MDLINLSKQRYTTKVYDPSKKIPQEQFEQLCTLLKNCPSSVNSQPWHFFVASTEEAKDKILPGIAEFNQPRVKNASHVIIFCAKTAMTEEHLQKVLAKEEQDGRFVDEQSKKGMDDGRRYFIGLNSTTPENLLAWESKQIYIALGTLLLGASTLGIDSTPIEGFDKEKINQILGLKEKGLTSVVIASLGYRSKEDPNATLPKSRLSKDDIFTAI